MDERTALNKRTAVQSPLNGSARLVTNKRACSINMKYKCLFLQFFHEQKRNPQDGHSTDDSNGTFGASPHFICYRDIP